MRKRPRQHLQVDHQYIARLCARHSSGDYVLAADRFCDNKNLGVLDKLRIRRLAAQQADIQSAIDKMKRGS